mmetsp:Transcript_19368/g.73217  ORF Transcript_19368/g.73217 Transcript_19368/m.73217 type:complete len:872 (-) Transcript_19368:1089-3704(-)
MASTGAPPPGFSANSPAGSRGGSPPAEDNWPAAILSKEPSRVVAIYDLDVSAATGNADQENGSNAYAKAVDEVVQGVERLCQRFGRAKIETSFVAAGVIFATLPDFAATKALVQSCGEGFGSALGPRQEAAKIGFAQPHIFVPDSALLNDTLLVQTSLVPASAGAVSGSGLQKIKEDDVPQSLRIFGCPIVSAYYFSSNTSGSYLLHAYVITYNCLTVTEDAFARLSWQMKNSGSERPSEASAANAEQGEGTIIHVGYSPLLDWQVEQRRAAVEALTKRVAQAGVLPKMPTSTGQGAAPGASTSIYGFPPFSYTQGAPAVAGAAGQGPKGQVPQPHAARDQVPAQPFNAWTGRNGFAANPVDNGMNRAGAMGGGDAGNPAWSAYKHPHADGSMGHGAPASASMYAPLNAAFDANLNPGAQPFVMSGDAVVDNGAGGQNPVVLMGNNALTLTPFQTESGQIVYVASSLQPARAKGTGAPQNSCGKQAPRVLVPAQQKGKAAQGGTGKPAGLRYGQGAAGGQGGSQRDQGSSQKGRGRDRYSNNGGSGSFVICKRAIREKRDNRTTVMVRNIPNKYAQQMLLGEIDETFRGTYDFFYLPIDFKNRCNVGYAFINFCDPATILRFLDEFDGRRWRRFNSEKICAVSYARIQGKQAMIQRFQHSSLMEKEQSYKPLLFYSDGPLKGQPEPFPVPAHGSSNSSSHGGSSSSSTDGGAGLHKYRGHVHGGGAPSYASQVRSFGLGESSNPAPSTSKLTTSDVGGGSLGLGSFIGASSSSAQSMRSDGLGARGSGLDPVGAIEALMANWQPLVDPHSAGATTSGSSSDSDPSPAGASLPSSLGLGIGVTNGFNGWDTTDYQHMNVSGYHPTSSRPTNP